MTTGVLEPDPRRWPELAARRFESLAGPAKDQALRTRAELGLPTDRPVVMSGHQAEFWHPGILAKWFATDACARRIGGHAAWILVDQDDNDPTTISFPVLEHDVPTPASIKLGLLGHPGPRLTTEGVPTGRLPMLVPPAHWAAMAHPHPAVGEGLERLFGELVDLTLKLGPGASAADQLGAAYGRLLPRGCPTLAVLPATRLNTTLAFRELVALVARDPRACAAAYNHAAAREPHAAVAMLKPGELPLWRFGAERFARRTTVSADHLASIPADQLHPKALAMTACLRLAACDLFIHGTGGAAYDRVTDAWLDAWLGTAAAPTVMATATVYIPGCSPTDAQATLARAQWALHHARHNPPGSHKPTHLARINALERGSQARRDAYLHMHAELARHQHGLDQLNRDLDTARRASRLDETVARAWPFPVYPLGAIHALSHEIRARFQPS